MDKQTSSFRWVVFASVLVTYLLMSSQRTAPGLITEEIMSEFQVTAATIGMLTSIQFFVYTGLQIPMGMLADRYGPNFFLIVGAALTGIGTILYSLGTHEIVLFIARILTGTGDATIWVNMVLILGQWFKVKEFTRLIGIAGMTGSLGFLLATVPYSYWIDYFGWRGAFFSFGVFLCLCGLLLYFVLVKKAQVDLQDEKVIEAKTPQREKSVAILKRIVSKRQSWALFLCHFGVVGGYVGFISSWAVPYGMNVYGMVRKEASLLIMIGLVGALIGAPLMSYISSRVHTIKKPYVLVHLLMVVCWSFFLLFQGFPPLSILMVLFFLIGFGYGASALTFALVRQTFPIKEAGIVSGFANTGGFLSAVLLPSIFGFILDSLATMNLQYQYSIGFISPVLFSSIGLVGVLLIKE